MRNRILSILGLAVCLSPAASAQWTALNHQPSIRVYAYFLLKDGRVLANECTQGGTGTERWWTLTPDSQGSYVNGTWDQVGSSRYTHLYFGNTVTPDGRVLVAGGEYSTGGSETNKCEIFDPVSNTWSDVTPPSGWSNIGDAPSATLADNRMILGSIFDSRTAFFDPATTSFSPGPNALNSRETEETWVLLPDGTIGKWDCFEHPGSERYLPGTNQWISCGNTPVDLVLPSSYETGGGVVLNDGRFFCIGGTPHTAFYTCPANVNDPGTWTQGPDPANINGFTIGAEDAPASLLPDGHVLLALGRVSAGGGQFYAPTYFHEYDGTNIVRVADAPNSSGPPYVGRMLILPTGDVMWTAGTASAYLYNNGGQPDPAWKPTITGLDQMVEKDQTYTLYGKLLCGMSNGASYGDEVDPATNYPIARLQNPDNGNVYYVRTLNNSTRQIQTGDAILSTDYIVNPATPAGTYDMYAVANGIASDPQTINVMNSYSASRGAVVFGRYISGRLGDVQNSDDSYIFINRRNAQDNPPVQVTVTGSTNELSPASLGFSLEDGVNVSGVTRTIELLNVQTSQYEQIDMQAAQTGDTVTQVAVGNGSLSRFVDQQNGHMTARLSYFQTGSQTNFRVRFDRVAFLTN